MSEDKFEKANRQRLSIINKEFEGGFKFLKNHRKSVSIFGSSDFKEDNPFYEHARILGQRIVKELKYEVITGGGPGIMEAANRGAYEAGGSSLGLNINLPTTQRINNYLTEHIEFYYFFSRKVFLSFAAEAYVFYPGGFGTLDEFFEILTLVQTKKIINVPIILVGKEFWKNLDNLITEQLLKKYQTIGDGDSELYTINDSHDEIIDIIRKSKVREGLTCCGVDLV